MKRLRTYLTAGAVLLGTACTSPDKPAEQPAVALPAAPTKQTAAAPSADKALQRFAWEDEVCQNTGYFAPGQYSEAELRDTYVLVNFPGIVTSESVWKLAELRADTIGSRLRRLEAEYQSQLTKLRALRVVPLAYWRRLKQLRQLELREDYELRRLELRAYFNPQLLLSDSISSDCRPYAQALASPDTAQLFRAWRQLVQAQKLHNGSPEHLEEKYQSQYRSPDRESYARIELMLFGWWNCVNGAKKHGEVSNQQLPSVAFEKLFSKVEQSDCADVD